MKRRSIIIIAVMLLVCIFLTGCAKITEREEQKVVATVTSVRFHAGYTTFTSVPVGKSRMLIPQPHPAQYLVTVTYKDLSSTFDSHTLYHQVKEGDSVEVTLVSGYTADHELVKQYLQY